MVPIKAHFVMFGHSPDLNLTPLAAFLLFCRAQRGCVILNYEIIRGTPVNISQMGQNLAALGKNVKKQQEVSDLNQD